jgi:hypothetical protein
LEFFGFLFIISVVLSEKEAKICYRKARYLTGSAKSVTGGSDFVKGSQMFKRRREIDKEGQRSSSLSPPLFPCHGQAGPPRGILPLYG